MRPVFWPSRIPASLLILCLLWHVFPGLISAAESTSPRRSTFHIGSFNIQVFGQSKVNKPFVKEAIVAIISRYDIIFIQEIRDDKNEAIYRLLDLLNQGSSRNYQGLVSSRLGRGEMKEQYAYFYDADVVTAIDSYVFNDAEDDFSREPFVARFKGQGRSFTLAGIHTTPTNVRGELKSLPKVKVDVENRYGDNNIFIMGDFNADCSYYKPAEGFDFFDEAPRMMILDDQDTTVSPGSCAYDRVMGFGRIQEHTSSAKAFNFMDEYNYGLAYAKLISDHYPVEFTIKGTGSLAKIDPIPSPAQPQEADLPTLQLGSEASISQNQISAIGSCGIEPYLTLTGRCYASFDEKKIRVSLDCCPR